MPHYRALTGKVDGFFQRVMARHPDQMQCGSGCADCCHTRLSITHVEADAIAAHVATLSPAARAELAALAARPVDATDPRCAALGDDDRCRIYDARPIVCRSHGVPIRLGTEVTACHRNFRSEGADPDCILDQTTLSTTLLAIDRAHGGDGDRIDLAELLLRELS